MGILDNSPLPVPPLQAPALSPDLQAMIAQNAAPQAQPMPQQAPAGLPNQVSGPKVLDPAVAQKSPNLVVPGVVVNGHLFKGGDKTDENNWEPLSGNDYLATIPMARANIVRSILAGGQKLPNISSRSNDALSNTIVQDVAMAEPTFNSSVWGARNKLFSDMSSGKTAGQIQNLNQMLQHAAGLQQANDQLGNLDTGQAWPNAIRNAVRTLPLVGDPKVAARLNAATENADALGTEQAAVMQGGAPHVEATKSYTKLYDPNQGPTAMSGSLGKAAQLAYSRLDNIQQKWANTMGDVVGSDPTKLGFKFPIISPQTQKAVDALKSRYDLETGDPIAQAPKSALPQPQNLPRTGAPKIRVWNPETGSLE